jgi:hypothetical protein
MVNFNPLDDNTGSKCVDLLTITSETWSDIYPLTFIIYSETSIHRFRRGSEKETMDLGKQ